MLVHATTVAIGGKGVLIRGRPGSGKSDLALRLIDAGARLVADDQTEVERDRAGLVARAPRAIAGKLEVRGLGIVGVKAVAKARLALAVDLVAGDAVDRMPAPAWVELLGLRLPLIRLAGFQASAPAKLRLALVSLAHKKAIIHRS
jgi:serine kinase of HPr protein (carbohydrate metabolism regulator)